MGENGRWEPFVVCPQGTRAPSPRGIESAAGVGDRLRTAAFAELQAREAFRWAAASFPDADEELRRAWEGLASAEDRHLGWLLGRMAALAVDVRERPVSAALWDSLARSKTARDFALLIASAEERGRQAGEKFRAALQRSDPESAAVFGRIADEELAHVELASRHFGSGVPRG